MLSIFSKRLKGISSDANKKGWTITSGEYDFIGMLALFVQKIWDKSPPPFKRLIAL